VRPPGCGARRPQISRPAPPSDGGVMLLAA